MTRAPIVGGVDIGTTNLKVVALDRDGTVVARAVRPTPRESGTSLIDAIALVAAIEEMIVAVCGDRYRLESVCAAGMGEDGVLLDAEFVPTVPALSWFDPRRQDIFAQLRPDLGADHGLDTAADPTRTLVGWAWARRHPGFAAGRTWVALADVASAGWAQKAFLSDTLASRTSAWRSSGRAWDADRVLATLGSVDLLPPVVRSGEIVGTLTAPSLRAAGVVAADALVVAGGHDHPVGGWGVDRMVPGVVLDSMGTAEVIVTQARGRAPREGVDVDVAPGILSPAITVLRVEELARNVQWASQDAEVGHHLRDLLGGRVPPVPVLEAGYFEPGRRGGESPSYAPDTPADPRVRASAVLGALAMVGREAVAAVRAEAGGAGEVRLAGGWLRSPGWVDVKAAVHGVRVAPILEPQVTAVGAALLAAEARGWRPDPARALSGFTALLH